MFLLQQLMSPPARNKWAQAWTPGVCAANYHLHSNMLSSTPTSCPGPESVSLQDRGGEDTTRPLEALFYCFLKPMPIYYETSVFRIMREKKEWSLQITVQSERSALESSHYSKITVSESKWPLLYSALRHLSFQNQPNSTPVSNCKRTVKSRSMPMLGSTMVLFLRKVMCAKPTVL